MVPRRPSRPRRRAARSGFGALIALVAAIALCPVAVAAAETTVSVSPDPPTEGQPATYTAVLSEPDPGPITWDFDGGEDFEREGSTVEHTFATAGDKQIRVRVGEEEPITRTVVVNAVPQAAFAFAPRAPRAGEAVLFASSSSDEGGPVEHHWDFGDGTEAAGRLAWHTYATAGTWTVTLTASDEHGATDVTTEIVEVAPAAVEAPPEPPPAPPAGAPDGGADDPPAGRATMMSPFPIVRIAGRVLRSGARIRVLSVLAPEGATVRARCRGARCRVRPQAKRSRGGRVRLRRFERRLPAGVAIEVRVRQRGSIGKYTRFTIRRARSPRRVDRCLKPGASRPTRCPRR